MAQWENINSEGLDRWGHFTSSKRSMELHEPIYTNLWTAQILPSDLPNGMLAFGYGADDVKIVLEGLRSIGGLQTQRGTSPAEPSCGEIPWPKKPNWCLNATQAQPYWAWDI